MEFRPADFLASAHSNPGAYLIILNAPIKDFEVFRRVWAHSMYRICADGGANRLHDLFDTLRVKRKGEFWRRDDFLPDLIHGDLDSLQPDVQEYYSDCDVQITKDDDKYSTDFGKVMKQIKCLTQPAKCVEIIILSSLSGRVDHGIGLLHELYRESLSLSNSCLWLFSESSCSFLLLQGRSRIVTASEDGKSPFTRNVGILPIYGPATISTKGFEWDVQDWRTEMGGQVSTSNHVVDMTKGVEIETDHPVLFTIELADLSPVQLQHLIVDGGKDGSEGRAGEITQSGLQLDGRVE